MRRTACLLAIGLSMNSCLSSAYAAVPALGSREGELLCAGWTNVLATGALLSTGSDAAILVKAHGFFLGRLSVIAPDAKYSLPNYIAARDRMTEADRAQLGEMCIAKLKEAGGFVEPPSPTNAR